MFSERFEPRSHFKSRSSLSVRVKVVLNRTVVVDSDWRFDNLRGSHLLRVKVSCIASVDGVIFWLLNWLERRRSEILESVPSVFAFQLVWIIESFYYPCFFALQSVRIYGSFAAKTFTRTKTIPPAMQAINMALTFSIVLFFNYICFNNKCIYVLPFTCSVKNKRHILDIIQRIWNHLFLPCYIITSLVKHFLHKIH